MIKEDRLSKVVIGSAIEVHRVLGPGFLSQLMMDTLVKSFFVIPA